VNNHRFDHALDAVVHLVKRQWRTTAELLDKIQVRLKAVWVTDAIRHLKPPFTIVRAVIAAQDDVLPRGSKPRQAAFSSGITLFWCCG
jgi:hypothetical protein